MAIIGIDLGTTNSLVCCWKEGKAVLVPNSLGSKVTPSVVSVLEDEILVGEAAKVRRLTHINETAASFKRFMGTKKKYLLGSQEFSPVELSALVLKKLKQDAEKYLGEAVEEAIITVPAYFNDKQRSDTKMAARLSGLKVERLINEPSAAALAYQIQQGKEDGCLLVFDFGGGTLDISLVECFNNIIEIEAVAGDNHLGGDDIDVLLYEDLINRHHELSKLDGEGLAGLRKELIEAKCRLGDKEEERFTYRYEGIKIEDKITRKRILELCIPILERIRYLFTKVLCDGQCNIEDIEDVIMVGGSSKLQFIQQFIGELFQMDPVVMEDTDLVVAKGVGIYAGIRMRDADIKDYMMTDVCPFSLGTGVVNGKHDERPHMCFVIERNCPLPFSKTVKLTTISDFQENMVLGIYQGEEYFADENVFLGDLRIGIRAKPAGEESVLVTYSYDVNGVLQVKAENSMGQTVNKLITHEGLTRKEIEESLKRLEGLEVQTEKKEEYQLLLAKLNWLFEQQTGHIRNTTGEMIFYLNQAWENGRHHLYRKAKGFVEQWIGQRTSEMERFVFPGDLLLELNETDDAGDDKHTKGQGNGNE